jgi:hypothetical protein
MIQDLLAFFVGKNQYALMLDWLFTLNDNVCPSPPAASIYNENNQLR